MMLRYARPMRTEVPRNAGALTVCTPMSRLPPAMNRAWNTLNTASSSHRPR